MEIDTQIEEIEDEVLEQMLQQLLQLENEYNRIHSYPDKTDVSFFDWLVINKDNIKKLYDNRK